ncbi:MAG TPA: hypothetical protein VMV40_00040 [Acidiferrobacter sp.]|nr:hypothetical protein [Acidiferrobacter sp.]
MHLSFWTQPWPITGVVVAAWLVLYVARPAFHKVVRASTRLVRQPLQLVAHFLRLTASDMQRRNQALLRAEARAEAGLQVEREWARLDEVVRRDVQGFPALQTELLAQIEQWDADFKRSAEVPQASPEWIKAVAAIGRLRSADDPMVDHLQSAFKGVVEKAHRQTLTHYQKAATKRHRLLARSQRMWRAVSGALARVDNRLTRVVEHAAAINSAVERYQALSQAVPGVDRSLVSSAFVRLLVAGFVLLVAAGGAVINLHLIAAPLSELGVGHGVALTDWPASVVVAFVIIAMEIVAGLVLFDALNITHIFSPVTLLAKTVRHWLIGVATGLLLGLAGLEAILVFVQESAIKGAPVVGALAVPNLPMWQAVAEGILALVLPCVMAFIAIPLESFIYALRAVTGLILEGLVRVLAFVARVGARALAALGDTLAALYDLVILPPLLLERLFRYGTNVRALRKGGVSGNR